MCLLPVVSDRPAALDREHKYHLLPASESDPELDLDRREPHLWVHSWHRPRTEDCSGGPDHSQAEAELWRRTHEVHAGAEYGCNTSLLLGRVGLNLWAFLPPCCKVRVAQLCLILRPHGLYSPWNSPGQNTGVGSLSLLQGIFSTQGLNPGLLHCRQILYQLSHKGSPPPC